MLNTVIDASRNRGYVGKPIRKIGII